MGETTTPFSHVRDIPEDYALETNSQDIEATLGHIGQLERIEDVGCLFTQAQDGEITAVYMCTQSVPYLDARVYRLA